MPYSNGKQETFQKTKRPPQRIDSRYTFLLTPILSTSFKALLTAIFECNFFDVLDAHGLYSSNIHATFFDVLDVHVLQRRKRTLEYALMRVEHSDHVVPVPAINSFLQIFSCNF